MFVLDDVAHAPQIMEDVASDNRTHMVAIGKEYQDMVNQLITVLTILQGIQIHPFVL